MKHKELHPQIRAKIKQRAISLLKQKPNTSIIKEGDRGVNYMYTETEYEKTLNIYFRGRVECFRDECGCEAFSYQLFSNSLRTMQESDCSIELDGQMVNLTFEYEQSWLSITASSKPKCRYCEGPVDKRRDLLVGHGVFIDEFNYLSRRGTMQRNKIAGCPMCLRVFK